MIAINDVTRILNFNLHIPLVLSIYRLCNTSLTFIPPERKIESYSGGLILGGSSLYGVP